MTGNADTLFHVHNLRGQAAYLACGDYMPLLNDVVFLTGWRGALEKLWLRVQYMYPRRFTRQRVMQQSWQHIERALQTTPSSALFWQTGWYKPTHFVGGLTTDDRRLFVKLFKHADDAALSVRQNYFVAHYFSAQFQTVLHTTYRDQVVLYPLLPHHAKPLHTRDMAARLLAIHTQHYQQFKHITKPAVDFIHLNLPSLLQKSGHAALWQTIRAALQQDTPVSLVPVHGDATPWNMFYSDGVLPVLVDYERAGWHVPFYDCWHFYCQPVIMQFRQPDIMALITQIQTATGLDLRMLQQAALLYILDQLAHDYQDQDDYPLQKNHFSRTIPLKMAVLQTLFAALYD